MDEELRKSATATAALLAEQEYPVTETAEGTTVRIAATGIDYLFRVPEQAEHMANALRSQYVACFLSAFDRTWAFKAEVIKAADLLKQFDTDSDPLDIQQARAILESLLEK